MRWGIILIKIMMNKEKKKQYDKQYRLDNKERVLEQRTLVVLPEPYFPKFTLPIVTSQSEVTGSLSNAKSTRCS